MRRLQPNGGQRYARLDAALNLEQLDLQIGSGGKIRLVLLQPPQLGDLAWLRTCGGWRGRLWRLGFAHREILAELSRTPRTESVLN